jgi:hypothetical protein
MKFTCQFAAFSESFSTSLLLSFFFLLLLLLRLPPPLQITEVIFAYINMLRSEGPQEWIYNENLEVASNNFRFLSKSKPQGYACSLAERMQNYKPEDVLSGPYFTKEVRMGWSINQSTQQQRHCEH